MEATAFEKPSFRKGSQYIIFLACTSVNGWRKGRGLGLENNLMLMIPKTAKQYRTFFFFTHALRGARVIASDYNTTTAGGGVRDLVLRMENNTTMMSPTVYNTSR